MIIKPNALSEATFTTIKNELMAPGFPWFYNPRTSHPGATPDLYNGSFANAFPDDSRTRHCLIQGLEEMLGSVSLKLNKIHRIRAGLIPVCAHPVIHAPHVDHFFPHTSLLLYINDSDGDTVFYRQHYDTSFPDMYTHLESLGDSLTVECRVKPEENKAVIFNGMTYHASSAPMMTKRRIAISYTFDA